MKYPETFLSTTDFIKWIDSIDIDDAKFRRVIRNYTLFISSFIEPRSVIVCDSDGKTPLLYPVRSNYEDPEWGQDHYNDAVELYNSHAQSVIFEGFEIIDKNPHNGEWIELGVKKGSKWIDFSSNRTYEYLVGLKCNDNIYRQIFGEQ